MKHIQFLSACVAMIATIFALAACGENAPASKGGTSEPPLFERIKPGHSGIQFENTITETEKFNAIFYDGIYWGAGVGVGDFNNDGLQDLFFVGNMTPSKLYLNKGDFKFEDITKKAGIEGIKGWPTGVTIADVNADGFLDIYVCRHVFDDLKVRTNLFYVNNGDLTFTERAAEYGIADAGFSISANFFDYDKDGWLDLFVVNQPVNNLSLRASMFRKKEPQYSNRLYRNNGAPPGGRAAGVTFTDVTRSAGIENFAFSLSATVSDMDRDGWSDIYVSCDFYEPDMFFKNNGNGTFTNIAQTALRHTSNFSMGADIADFNNDGWMDIYVADMVAEDNFRNKTNMGGMNPKQFWEVVKKGGHHQYMYNALQLNNGITSLEGSQGSDGMTFSEIAQMSGVSNTDWSWSPLFVDFDNDGWKDLYVSNGLLRDVRNKDYHHKGEELLKEKMKAGGSVESVRQNSNPLEFIRLAPSKKVVNYLYRNKGDLTFEQKMEDWGTNDPTWTQGAAYADFDNDGDMDLVLNNTNEPAILYKNQSSERKLNHFLDLKLTGEKPNLNAIGTNVKIEYDGKVQVQEVSPVRGFMSTSENIVHFGLADKTAIEKLTVRWPDGREITLQNVPTNQRLTLHQKDAKPGSPAPPHAAGLLEDLSPTAGIDFRHKESVFDDYAKEILLPYRMSNLGPCLATADVNGDQLEDFFVGGAAGQSGALFLQKKGASFQRAAAQPWSADAAQEDVGALFFDADGDGDADLYVCSGSNEFPEGSPLLQDRLYLNGGGGNFSKAANGALPKFGLSSSKADAADFDGDGDLDLFVGGRQLPGKYGHPVSSIILRNNQGIFQDATAEVAPQLQYIGMVTDGHWMDFDQDKDLDLVVAGEWMPLTFFKNEQGKLSNVTKLMGMEKTAGWWNCLQSADLDADGDLDLVAGNLGLNLKHKASEERPFKCYVKDFDGNGTNDIYLGYYDKSGVCYPVRGRQCSSQQMPFVAEKFASYEAFAKTDIEHVLEGKLEGAIVLQAFMFESVWLENLGGGQFRVNKLPNEAQIFPVHGIVVHDWNKDGKADIYLAGNFHEREVETTRSDAGTGCVLMGNGKGSFATLRPWEIGALANRDVRSVKMVKDSGGNPLLLVANCNDAMQVLRVKPPKPQ